MDGGNVLSKLWYSDSGGPGAFSGISQLYQSAKDVDETLTLSNVKEFLSNQLPYQVHRQALPNAGLAKLARNTNVYNVSGPGLQLGIDTMYLVKSFSPFRFAQVSMDLFSRYAWVYPSRVLNAKISTEALKVVLSEQPSFSTVLTDNGSEYAREFDQFCSQNGIEHIRTNSVTQKHHVSPIERVIRSLKLRSARILSNGETKDAGKALQIACKSYNASFHRSIDRSPASITKENASEVLKHNFHEKFEKLDKAYGKYGERLFEPIFRQGQPVRKLVVSPKGHFKKESDQTFSHEVYLIDDIDYDGDYLPTYRLSSLDGLQLPGHYVQTSLIPAEELWRDNRRVDRVIKGNPENGEHFEVTFKGYPQEFSESVSANDLKFYRHPYGKRFGNRPGSIEF